MIGNVAKEVLREKAEEGNQETTLEVVLEEIEVMVEEGEARAFYSNKGEEACVSIRPLIHTEFLPLLLRTLQSSIVVPQT